MTADGAPTETGDTGPFASVLDTIDERHAAIIGLSVGLLAGLSAQYEFLFVFALVTLGYEGGFRVSKKVKGAIRRESWYALGSVVIGVVAARVGLVAGFF
jgi:hypothetical protein